MELALAIMPGFIWHILFANRCGVSLKNGVWEFLAPVLLNSVFWFFVACVIGFYFEVQISSLIVNCHLDKILDVSKIVTESQNVYLIKRLLQASFYSFTCSLALNLNPFIETVLDKLLKREVDFSKSIINTLKEFYFVIFVLVIMTLFLTTYPLRGFFWIFKELTCIVYSYSDRELQKFLKYIIRKNTDEKNSGVMIVLSNDHFFIGKIVEADLGTQDGNGVIQILTLASGKMEENGESKIRTTYQESHKLNRLIFIREIVTIKDFNLNHDLGIIRVINRIDPIKFSFSYEVNEVPIGKTVTDWKRVVCMISLLIVTVVAAALFVKAYFLYGLITLILQAIVILLLSKFKYLT